jgi:hypothetical protein
MKMKNELKQKIIGLKDEYKKLFEDTEQNIEFLVEYDILREYQAGRADAIEQMIIDLEELLK